VRKATAPIPFAGSQLDETRHVCAFFNSEDEGYRVLLPFIKDGFDCGDKAIHVVDPERYQAHLRRLSGSGIEPAEAIGSGQLELLISTETYLQRGRFDQDRMLATFEELVSRHGPGGFPRSRIVCSMDWASNDESHLNDLIEFESRVNDLWSRHEDAVICVYDLSKIGGDVVVDVMRTHPMIVIGGTLQRNPFHVAPADFLRERRDRRAADAPAVV